jgi:glycosyltransferase involved in cell wall biosynthesis
VRILFVLSGNSRDRGLAAGASGNFAEAGTGTAPGYPAISADETQAGAGTGVSPGYSDKSNWEGSVGYAAKAAGEAAVGGAISSAGGSATDGVCSDPGFSAVNSTRPPSLPVKNPVHQAATLRELGHEVDLFFIRGRGLTGYLSAVPAIRREIKRGRYDIVHAHYSLSAFAVSLAGCHRMVVSLAGSDVMGNTLLLPVTRLFCHIRWKKVIVKTEEMKARLKSGKITVIPNGVDMKLFTPSPKREAREVLGLPDKKIVLFAADPSRAEKNHPLAQEAVRLMGRDDAMLLTVHGVPHDRMPFYYNASDALILTSLWEGSVNSVKEAMACNLPVVSTDVGDVRINTSGLDGYYITVPDAAAMAEKLNEAVDLNVQLKARERLIEMKLDSASVARRLIEIYNSVNS